MQTGKEAIAAQIAEIERLMNEPDFWADKEAAQAAIKQYQELKDKLAGVGVYDKGDAVITIFSGAGGDDAEDFTHMLFEMYLKYAARQGWGVSVVHEHENDHGGYRNITFHVEGKNVYGMLKHESGVHRLVRISPFSAKDQRHTSFSMVEVVPVLPKGGAIDIPEQDLSVEFARSGGPGGQNVNKRETAVRMTHIPTGLSVHATSERSQQQNREKALDILKGKIFKYEEERRMKEEAGFHVSKTTEAEWGSQIRSYVLHPYKLVKDHRTDVEVRDTEAVLEEGDLDAFIEAERAL